MSEKVTPFVLEDYLQDPATNAEYRIQVALERIEELERVCAETYQVIGALADKADCYGHPQVIKAMDNASQAKLVHEDLLPFSLD